MKTRKEMVSELIRSVEDWDRDTLIGYVQAHYVELYRKASDESILFDYQNLSEFDSERGDSE